MNQTESEGQIYNTGLKTVLGKLYAPKKMGNLGCSSAIMRNFLT